MGIDDRIAGRWRDLGFWYDVNEESGWELRGSAEGLSRFVAALRAYAADPRNATVSEHQHFGPYQYLEVCTMERADVNEHCIQGAPGDLARLADLLESRLRASRVGDRFDLAPEYCERSTLPLVVQVEPEGFDPASLDPDRGSQTK